jgi:hypothetical protein
MRVVTDTVITDIVIIVPAIRGTVITDSGITWLAAGERVAGDPISDAIRYSHHHRVIAPGRCRVNGWPVVVVVTTRAVEAGEEVLTFYGEPWWHCFGPDLKARDPGSAPQEDAAV